jgi:hypothetical protein
MLPNAKEAAWKAALDHVNKITDKLGMPVDKGIVETVAVLQLLGVDTSMSCAGHSDRVTGGPYVIFESKEAEECRKKCAAIKDPGNSSYKEWARKAQVALLEHQSQLYKFLDKFYQGRQTPFKQRLIIHTLGLSAYRLNAQGAQMALLGNTEKRNVVLTSCQKEMSDFTEFLKRTSFES